MSSSIPQLNSIMIHQSIIFIIHSFIQPSVHPSIDDDIDTSNTKVWKYVDDTTIAEPVAKNKASMIQNDVNELVARSEGNKFQLNQEKCKELRISFAKNNP